VQVKGLGKLKKFIHLIGSLTGDLPACSIVLKPTTLPCGLTHAEKGSYNFPLFSQNKEGGSNVEATAHLANVVTDFNRE
jgi:hypothetical protein